MASETFNVCLEHRNVKKWIVVYPNIPRNELYDVVCSAFNLENLDVSGIRSESGVSFPFFVGCHWAAISGLSVAKLFVMDALRPWQNGQRDIAPSLLRLFGEASHS